MKLRTEMQDHGEGCMVPRESNVNFRQNVEAMQHDAASAHALMRAIDEIGTRGIQDADEIANLADELMREWGFE